jgi:glycosyltransferase involved in cell wall biosynthesis
LSTVNGEWSTANRSSMRILISGMFWSQPNTGSGQYVHNLLRGLLAVAPQHEYVLLLPARLRDHGTSFPAGVRVMLAHTPLDGRSAHGAKLYFEQVSVPDAARRVRADLVHVPYAAPPLRCPVPVVSTVHDIIWWVLPEYAGSAQARAYFHLVSLAIRRTARLITDSDHSRIDIIKHLGCHPDQVRAVHLAAGQQYCPTDSVAARALVWQRYGVAAPFVYYVGGFDARKNVPTLVRAWGLLRRSPNPPPATLLLAGKALGGDPRLFPDIDALIAAEGVADSVRRVSVPPEDGPLLYNAATAAVYPSRYEGFGLPPLEAMACGTPALASNASSLPEVLGDAGLLLPPDDPVAWAAALHRVLGDTDLRAALRQRGLERAATFSWERVARETAQVYADLASNAGR